MNFIRYAGAFALSTLMAATAQAALLLPSGPQTGLDVATVTAGGWTQCYSAAMGTTIGNNGENVLNVCAGDYMMMAARETGSNTLMIAAAALRSDMIVDTGHTSTTHLANGSEWWYSPEWSWGFTAAGDTVDNFECNIDASSPTGMCLHTFDFVGGYRINDITGLNDSTGYEKVFFVASANGHDVPVPSSLALLALGLTAVAVKRKQAAK